MRVPRCLYFISQICIVVLIIGLVSLIITGNQVEDNQEELLYRILGPLEADSPEIIDILTRAYLDPPDTQPYNLSTDKYYIENNKKFGGQNPDLIKSLFSNEKGGFFIEAGALDGEYLSNTLWLEQELGWSGLLVEPNKFIYEILKQKHRKSWSSNTCLSTSKFPKEVVLVSLKARKDFSFPMNAVGATHLFGVSYADADDPPFFSAVTERYLNVQCFPLKSYLLALNISTVDFFSLDVQGAENDILATLPWDTINFRVIMSENNKPELDDEFVNEMKERGFRLGCRIDENYIFIKIGDPKLDNISLTVDAQ